MRRHPTKRFISEHLAPGDALRAVAEAEKERRERVFYVIVGQNHLDPQRAKWLLDRAPHAVSEPRYITKCGTQVVSPVNRKKGRTRMYLRREVEDDEAG